MKHYTYSEPKKNFPKRARKKAGVYYLRRWCREDRKREWICTDCKTLRGAIEYRDALIVRHVSGKDPDLEVVPFRIACNAYLIDCSRLGVSDTFQKNLDSRAKHWCLHFGITPIATITPDQVERYLKRRQAGELSVYDRRRDWRDRSPKMKPLASSTMQSDARMLRAFFNWCRGKKRNFYERKAWLRENPAEAVRVPGVPSKRNPVYYLSLDEEKKLLEAARTLGPPWLAPLLVVALNCGFRTRTLLGLVWAHVDLKEGTWDIPPDLIKSRERFQVTVPVEALAVLREWRASTEDTGADEPLFGLRPGHRVRGPIDKAASLAGLKRFSLHDCRRHFLNNLRKGGVSPEVARALGGWKSASVVEAHYARIDHEEMREAQARAAKRRDGEKPPSDLAPLVQ